MRESARRPLRLRTALSDQTRPEEGQGQKRNQAFYALWRSQPRRLQIEAAGLQRRKQRLNAPPLSVAGERGLGLDLPCGENQERVLRIGVSDPPDYKVGGYGAIVSLQVNGLQDARAAGGRGAGHHADREAGALRTPLNPSVGANANREGDLLGLQPLQPLHRDELTISDHGGDLIGIDNLKKSIQNLHLFIGARAAFFRQRHPRDRKHRPRPPG